MPRATRRHRRGSCCDEPTAACDLQTDERIHETLLHGLEKELATRCSSCFLFFCEERE